MTTLSYFVVPPTFGCAASWAQPSYPISAAAGQTADVSVPAPALSFTRPRPAGRFQPGR
ncbi:MAG: hypothetical protein HDT16_01880 [Oscillibacter sp.]|nr:hypothetical protein [Oscillibacter sp.]